MPAIIVILSIIVWLFIAFEAMGSGLDTYLGEYEPAPISPVIAEIIDGVARPVHGIRDNGPCGETRPCVGSGVPEHVPPVPLPSPGWFLAGTIGVLAIMRRNKKK